MSATSPVAYNAAAWSGFLSVVVSAAASLTGLLFVALSINLKHILAYPHLTARAGRAVVTLVTLVLGGELCLVPGQSAHALGIELTVFGACASFAVGWLHRAALGEKKYMTRLQIAVQNVLVRGSQVPTLLCGVGLLRERGPGLYWLPATVLMGLVGAVLDAWVLLVEIER